MENLQTIAGDEHGDATHTEPAVYQSLNGTASPADDDDDDIIDDYDTPSESFDGYDSFLSPYPRPESYFN